MIAIRPELARARAIARRDVQIESSYRLRYAMRLLEVFVTAAIVYQLSKLVVDAPALAQYGGDYFDFAMVGLAVMSMAQLGISTFNQNILREQSVGTLEVLLSTPTPVAVLLAGSFVFPLLLTSIDLLLYFGVGIGIFGDGLRPVGVLYAVPLLGLTLGSFCAFGIVGASLVVLIKRGDPLTGPLTMLTSVLSGALFPVSTFPDALQVLARLFPAYYGINGLREALLTSAGWQEISPDVAVLIGFDLVLLPLSLYLFGRSLAVARQTGTLSNY
jgi:ABC-2 type transport system permease protein